MKRKVIIILINLLLIAITMAILLSHLLPDVWFIDMFSHFMLQYAVLLFCSIFILLSFRSKSAYFYFLPLIYCLFILWPFLPHSGNGNADPKLKVMTMNLLGENKEYTLATEVILEEQPDVIGFQEYNLKWHDHLESHLSQTYPFRYTIPQKGHFGIAIYSKFPLLNQQSLVWSSAGVPSIVADVDLKGKPLKIIVTHPLPPLGQLYFDERNEQLKNIGSYVALQAGDIMVIGDLNVSSFSKYFREMLESSQLHDSRRGHGLNMTWPEHFMVMGTTLDHCLLSHSLQSKHIGVGRAIGSDHLPVWVEFTRN